MDEDGIEKYFDKCDKDSKSSISKMKIDEIKLDNSE